MDGAEVWAMHARLQRVENRLRVVALGWLLSIVVFGVLAIGVRQAASQQQQTAPPLDLLRARSIEVVDAAGNARIALNVSAEGTAEIVLSESAGKGRMWFSVRSDGIPSAVLADAMGKGRIWMTAYPDRSSGLILSDATGKGRIWLGASSDGSSNLMMVDTGGRVVFRTP